MSNRKKSKAIDDKFEVGDMVTFTAKYPMDHKGIITGYDALTGGYRILFVCGSLVAAAKGAFQTDYAYPADMLEKFELAK